MFHVSDQVRENIVNFIRAGGYDWVAAEAAGIPADIFLDWLKQGAEHTATGPVRELYLEVMKARSQSRLKAEIDLREENTLAWLRYGPGREELGRPGWTESVTQDAKQAWKEVERLRADYFKLLGLLGQALRQYPDAQRAVLEVIRTSGIPDGPAPLAEIGQP